MMAAGFKEFKERECYSCHVKASAELFQRCPRCLAVVYCCEACRDCDWKLTSRYSHSKWCDRMKNFMEKTQILCKLPFTFIKETTDHNFDADKYHKFLERHGIYNQGVWKVESYNTSTQQAVHVFGTRAEFNDPIVLPVESCILDEDPKEHYEGTDWRGYYDFRGFRYDSPIAILLQWPLTLYHILHNCVLTDYKVDVLAKPVILVDLVGVEKEVDLCVLFTETAKLLQKKLDIHMFGPAVCQTVDLSKKTLPNVEVKIHHGLYHKKVGRRVPDIVIGFNAGLEAYTSWKDTVTFIQDKRIPAYFTDYCEHSVELSRSVLTELCNIQTSEVVINPFRSPVRKPCEEHDLPLFSNGFIFHMKYNSLSSV